MRVVHYFGKALRETGQAMDRFGLALTDTESFRETFTRHRTLVNMIEKVRLNLAPLLNFCVF